MNPKQLLAQNIALIDRVTQRVCRRCGIPTSEVDDVASTVKLALVENDYAILRRFEGRSSLATYLAVVIQRLLADQRERTHGRWRPSPEAQRLGQRAVLVEDLIGRQRRSIEEAIPMIRAVDPAITAGEIAAIAAQLPQRAPRPREVELPSDIPVAAAERADTAVLDGELRNLSQRAGALLRETMAAWPPDDRLLMRLRFESSLSIADISRLLGVPQRPLYRRIEALLRRLREVLTAAGIDPAAADDLLDASHRIEIDFALPWKTDGAHRTTDGGGRESREEHSI